jgi:Enoyl-CoA hydratase/isomerase
MSGGLPRRSCHSAMFSGLARLRVLAAIENMDKPWIATPFGNCLGGGLELPLACHFRVAALEGARIGLPELHLGTVPAWGGVLITDCVSTLSPIQWHLDGRAAGFFIGVYRSALGIDGEHVDLPDRFAYACRETAPPTAVAIGGLVQEALENAPIQFLHDEIAKGGRRHA